MVPALPGAYRLVKAGVTIYVGSTDNLARRFEEHKAAHHNACIARTGWDNFVYQTTSTFSQAQTLERTWYIQYAPKCNLVAPPRYRFGGLL